MEEIVPKPAPSTEKFDNAPIVEEEFPHLKPGRYTLRKSQVNINGRFFHTMKTFDVQVKVLEEDDVLLTEIGTRDPVAQTDYRPGERVIITTYKDGEEKITSMLRDDSFFLINPKLEERHFIPIEDR